MREGLPAAARGFVRRSKEEHGFLTSQTAMHERDERRQTMRRTTTEEKANAEGPKLDGKHFVYGEAADHNGTYGIFFFPSAVYTDHEGARHEQGSLPRQ